MTTETIIVLFEALLSLIVSFVVGCIYCWQEALVVLASSPIMIIGVIALSRLAWGNKGGKAAGSVKEVDVYDKANALLSDVVINYKTVISFGENNVEAIFDKFSKLMQDPLAKKVHNAHVAGFFYGYS